MTTSESDGKFLMMCEEVKRESHDPHRQVGVVIVDATGQIIAQGSNSPPREFGLTIEQSHSEIIADPKWKYFLLEHAERNAIRAAREQGESLSGSTLYGTLLPCADCARAIVAAGIRRVVVSTGDHDPARDEKWRDHYVYAHRIFQMGGVEVDTQVAPLKARMA